MHCFKLIIDGNKTVIKRVEGTYDYAINYMAGYIQSLRDTKGYDGIEVLYRLDESNNFLN